jgi:2-phospho-L-lactate transferase/gluconeogenesis factor (CofD/UPF0052 family)
MAGSLVSIRDLLYTSTICEHWSREMKIVILTGGTGSIALQRGLHEALETQLDGIDTKIIVNAYDNGLSTGAVRRVMEGRILGPSDVRKNQTTRLRLRDAGDPWLALQECRFTAEPGEARTLCNARVMHLMSELEQRGRPSTCGAVLLDAIARFFAAPLATNTQYEDFSLSNVIYAGLAAANGNSLRAAATIMAHAMEMPDNILLNDDRSLYLGAVTRSGRRITDEAEIVTWGRASDPIVDVFFEDAGGNQARPELCLESWQAIVEADLVILSSGTQWSSLIPTYASDGFAAAIGDSDAKVLLVMNRTPDKDSPGQSAAEIIEALVPRFFDEGRLHVLIDANADPVMRHMTETARARVASIVEGELSTPATPPDKHDPASLIKAIGYVCFKDYVNSDFFLFDYDDTLCGRANEYPRCSRFNVEGITRLNGLTRVGICTGNTIRALKFNRLPDDRHSLSRPAPGQLQIFADGGANEYSFNTHLNGDDELQCPQIVQCISPHALLAQTGPYSAAEITAALCRAGIPAGKIENRGNAVIAIKPIASGERRAAMSLARYIVRDSDLQVLESGRTTIEIRKQALSKVLALQNLCARATTGSRITYVGDELHAGNDHDIQLFSSAEPRVKCLHVGSPAQTAFFIYTLTGCLQSDVVH